ncbi:MAG: hypothetical protein WC948_01935 [Thermovirgaceae bacterium]
MKFEKGRKNREKARRKSLKCEVRSLKREEGKQGAKLKGQKASPVKGTKKRVIRNRLFWK